MTVVIPLCKMITSSYDCSDVAKADDTFAVDSLEACCVLGDLKIK